MNKRIISFLLSASLIFSISLSANATTILSQSKNEFSEVSSQIKELDEEIGKLNIEIDNLNEDIKNNESEIQSINSEISVAETKITSFNESLKENEDLLSSRLREMYKQGGNFSSDILLFVFSSDSISELISRVNSSKVLLEMDNKIISETQDMVVQIEDEKKEVEDKQSNLLNLNLQIKSSLEEVQNKQSHIEANKITLAEELSRLSSAIEENENKLVTNQIEIINSSNSIDDLNLSINTLNSLLSQISTQSVIKKVNSAIEKGNNKIASIKADSSAKEKEQNVSLDKSTTYKETYSMEATAYTAHTLTAMGIKPVRIPDGISSVAVDPKVIPLGSKLYIPGYGYALACDTGSAIKGNKIDLFMNSKDECRTFGRRPVTVHVIALPGEW